MQVETLVVVIILNEALHLQYCGTGYVTQLRVLGCNFWCLLCFVNVSHEQELDLAITAALAWKVVE